MTVTGQWGKGHNSYKTYFKMIHYSLKWELDNIKEFDTFNWNQKIVFQVIK